MMLGGISEKSSICWSAIQSGPSLQSNPSAIISGFAFTSTIASSDGSSFSIVPIVFISVFVVVLQAASKRQAMSATLFIRGVLRLMKPRLRGSIRHLKRHYDLINKVIEKQLQKV